MIILIASIVITLFFALALLSQSDHAPGLINNQLSPCPNKPNCICTEYVDDTTHFSKPIPLSGVPVDQAVKAIKNVLASTHAQIETEQEHYLATTFSSALFGFVDDVEFRIDPEQKLIHLRSAARVGYSDFGVNAERAQTLKTAITKQLQLNK